jgi:hypothetical protein
MSRGGLGDGEGDAKNRAGGAGSRETGLTDKELFTAAQEYRDQDRFEGYLVKAFGNVAFVESAATDGSSSFQSLLVKPRLQALGQSLNTRIWTPPVKFRLLRTFLLSRKGNPPRSCASIVRRVGQTAIVSSASERSFFELRAMMESRARGANR